MKRVVSIVDEDCFFQHMVVNVIKASNEFELGKVYSSAEEAIELLKRPTDIVFVEITLPGISGIELIKALHQNSSMQCIVYSKNKDDANIMSALESGAAGYIVKEAREQEIRRALKELLIGGAPLSPYIAKRVISFFQQTESKVHSTLLSEREMQVLQLLAKGLQYKQIADSLYISSETVKRHLHNIYHKLGVQNKIEAINKLNLLQERNKSKIP